MKAKAAEKEHDDDSEGQVAGSRHRSPNYPLFDLEKALERTRQIYEKDKLHPVPIAVVHDRWSLKAMGGVLKQTVGALKAYGLVAVEGEGNKRTLKVTERGRRILLDAPDKLQQLREAAIAPALFGSLWDKYRDDGMPSDEVLRHHLIFDRNFNEDSVADVIGRFRSTIAFAQLSTSDTIEEEKDGGEEDGGGADGKEAPAEKRRVEKRKMSAGMKEDVCSLDEGFAVLQWPERISAASAEDLKDWLDLMVKKIKRTISIARTHPDEDHDEDQNEDE